MPATAASPLQVACPTCAAPEGQPCRSYPEGAQREPHKDREGLARASGAARAEGGPPAR